MSTRRVNHSPFTIALDHKKSTKAKSLSYKRIQHTASVRKTHAHPQSDLNLLHSCSWHRRLSIYSAKRYFALAPPTGNKDTSVGPRDYIGTTRTPKAVPVDPHVIRWEGCKLPFSGVWSSWISCTPQLQWSGPHHSSWSRIWASNSAFQFPQPTY